MKSIKIISWVSILIFFPIGGHSQLWKQYSDSARVFAQQKQTSKSIEYYIKAKAQLGKDSMWTNTHVRACNLLANIFKSMGQYKVAEPYFVEAKQIREKVLGKEHSDYAVSITNLAGLYSDMGEYRKAEPLFLEAKQIWEQVPGKGDPLYATGCNNLGLLYLNMGQYEKSESLFSEGKQIRGKLLGKEHSQYAISCNNLGVLFYKMGQYEKAEPLYLEARQIWGKVHGKEHQLYATSCISIAELYQAMGQYEKAEPLYLEAKKINEKVLGKGHPDYASNCKNLADLYNHMGQYERAEALYLEAKKINEKVLDADHPDYALICNSLAALYYKMGQYEKAESLFLEARQIFGKVYGKEHENYASSCNNLAVLYLDMGQLKKAESLYQESMQIRTKTLGKEHPGYAISCNNFADFYFKIGQYEKAEPLYSEAKRIFEKVFGKEHPSYATGCNNLGALYFKMGQYTKAEPLALEAKQIREKVLGKESPEYAASLADLADLYRILNQYAEAETYYVESMHLKHELVKKIFQFTAEDEKQSFLKKSKSDNNRFFSFNYLDHSNYHQGLTYNVSLFNRNLILSSLQQLRSVIYSIADTNVKNKYNSWMSYREQISFWFTQPIAKRPAYVKDLDEQTNTLEKELTRLSSDFEKAQSGNEITWKNIQQKLKADEAAIEFVEFRFSTEKRWTDSTYYVALVLRKDKPEPELVQLFEKKQLDSLLNSTENLTTDYRINSLYTGNKSLYNLTWKPLEKYLTGISKVYFASAGNLFKISFAALPVNEKQVLVDKYQLIQLNTTATVTDNTQSFITANDKIRLYGGIKYDADSTILKQAVSPYQSGTASFRSLPDDLTRGEGFQYLPGTQQEAEEIKKLAGNTRVSILSGINASEESVKSLNGKNSPSVLHIATHGFFFPDPKDDKRDEIQKKFESSGKAFKQSDNPLFRSGLLFTGANNAWQGKPIEGIEDGILTAYEVSNMYLPNTKLVVLSACETALGAIQGSEGVYGLQRAFKMAGVQNLVMSLWKVPDAETAEFMQQFYKNLFAKQTISNAFYNAQQVMKNKYRAEPYKWAAWVLVR